MDLDTVFLVLRVVVSLGAVFGALFLGHRYITKGRAGVARTKQIAVVARQGLGAKAGVAIVDAHGRRYLLGVTEHTVTVLDTLGPSPEEGVHLVSTAPVALPGHGRTRRAGTAVADFERELQTVTLSTGAVPVLVHGGTDPDAPDGPITRILAITGPTSVASFGTGPGMGMGMGPGTGTGGGRPTDTPSHPGAHPTDAPSHPGAHPTDTSSHAAVPDVHLTRRAAREAQQSALTTPPPAGGALAGSVLSPQTWKQTVAALKQLR